MSAIGDAEQRAREFATFCDGLADAGFESFARRGRVVADDLLRALERLRAEHAARVKIQQDRDRALQLLGNRAGTQARRWAQRGGDPAIDFDGARPGEHSA